MGKSIGTVLLVVGIVILLVSVLADILGLGSSPGVFGYRQALGAVCGIVITVVGAVLYWRAGKQASG
jgi:hypothetical protein